MSEKKTRRPERVSVTRINIKVRKKLVGLFIATLLALVCLLARITYINATNGESYRRTVLTTIQQQYASRTIPYRRGDILDRNGTILASSERVYNLILDCKVVNAEVEEDGETETPYRDPTVNALVKMFGFKADELYERLDSEQTKESQYQIIRKNVTDEEKEKFEAYLDEENIGKDEAEQRALVNGVWFEETYMRVYPQGSQACDVIGFANSNGDASFGIEGYYSDILNGVNGRKFGYFDSDADVQQTMIEAINGKNVVSTIDINIQEIIRNAIIDFQASNTQEPDFTEGAKNIAVIVMDPNNGEILGMDSTNWYDLNDPYSIEGVTDTADFQVMSQEEQTAVLNSVWSNYCISDAIEPGSTAKIMTISAALETASVQLDDTFVCDGLEVVNGLEIHCAAWPNAHGTLSTLDALSQSCNDAFMQIVAKTGAHEFLDYLDRFKIGSRTGIDLPGENAGIVYSEDTMGTLELATSSFGQGFTCTMLQEACAFASVINGGYYYKPHVVSAVTDDSGNIIDKKDSILERQTVSAQTSDYIIEALENAVLEGTATESKVVGYSMGGKTGTAQKLPRSDGKYLVSFIGFAPVNNPQVLVYVVVDEPNNEKQDSSVYAQYIAKNILSETLPYLGVFPDEPIPDDYEETLPFFLIKEESTEEQDAAAETASGEENAEGVSEGGDQGENPENAENPEGESAVSENPDGTDIVSPEEGVHSEQPQEDSQAEVPSEGIADEYIPAPPEAAPDEYDTSEDSVFGEGIDNEYSEMNSDG